MSYSRILGKTKKITAKQLRTLPLLITLLLTLIAGNIPMAYAAGPTVAITSPTNGTIQQNTIDLSATAGADALGVTFKISGPMVSKTFEEDTTAPYSVAWDSTVGLNKVDYTITAVARGTGGNTTSAPVKVRLNNSPIPGKVIVVGDSVSQQAFDPDADGTFNYTTNAPAAADRNVFAQMGWSTKDVQTTVNNYSIFRWPQKLVVAMGLNDAGVFFSDGWNPDDLERFRTLINTPHADACVALVLPGYGETGDTPWFNSWTTEIDQARADLTQLATERPNTLIVDWQPVIDAHPEYVDNDGIHLNTPNSTWQQDLQNASQGQMTPVDPVAAEARQEFYWEAAAKCEAPEATFQTPTDTATVEGTVPLEVNATAAESVQFQIDGTNIGAPVTSAPFQIDWDSTTTTNGTHTITALTSNAVGTHTTSITVDVQNPPVPGSVGLIGDSVTFNSLNSTGAWEVQTFFGNKPENLLHSYWPGAAHPNSQGSIEQWAANRTPEILIDAYGFNDAAPAYPIYPYWQGDGFSDTDRANVLASLNTPHVSTCKVLVLPGWGIGLGYVPASDNPSDDAALLAWELEYIQELNEVRDFYSQLATERDDIILVDWQPIIDEHPEYMDPDGVHLAHKSDGSDGGWRTDAAEARQVMYWDGVAQCQTLLANR